MPDKKGDQTRDDLISASLHLFAMRGIHSVTVRDILQLTRQRNQSVVHYYFGNKDGLIAEVLRRVHDLLDPLHRAAQLEMDARARDSRLSPRDIVRCMTQPLIALYHSGPIGHDAVWLIARLISDAGDWGQTRMMAEVAPFLCDIDQRLAACLPTKSREKLRLQIMLTAGSLLFGLIALETLRHPPFSGGGALYQGRRADSINDAIDMLCFGLGGTESVLLEHKASAPASQSSAGG